MSRVPDFTRVPLDAETTGTGPARAPWATPEGIAVAPAYGPDALENLDVTDGLPGIAPYLRGPYPTMYASNPWTIRQYAGFSTAEASNAFYRRNLAAGRRGCRSPSTWPLTAATIPTIPASPATSAWPAWRSTPSSTCAPCSTASRWTR